MDRYLLQLAVFAGATVVLTWLSRGPLRKPGSHGFYRYFAWECMTVMFVLAQPTWYDDLHSWHQTIAGGLFFTSLLLVASSLYLMWRHGKADRKRDDVPMFGFEKTTALVTTGLFRFIRHPMYASLFFLCWGFFFKQPSIAAAVFGLVATGFLVATARAEEAENINYFGESYREYMKRSKMFVPFIL